MGGIKERKAEHIRFCLDGSAAFRKKTAGFEKIDLLHNALPELNAADISTANTFLSKPFSMPIMVAPITGGFKGAKKINTDIAEACNDLGIGMALGSIKAMIKDKSLKETYDIRHALGDNLLATNFGANDLKNFAAEDIIAASESLQADVLGIHLNTAQELVQPEGDSDFTEVLEKIDSISRQYPIYVREVSSGISGEVARLLSKTKIKAIDVGGAGGTSWTAIEYLRSGKSDGIFWDWGIPTAECIRQVKSITELPMIATGGIRSGLDIAKAIALGADIVGIAAPILQAQNKSGKAAISDHLKRLCDELKSTMFLCGSKDIDTLNRSAILLDNGQIN